MKLKLILVLLCVFMAIGIAKNTHKSLKGSKNKHLSHQKSQKTTQEQHNTKTHEKKSKKNTHNKEKTHEKKETKKNKEHKKNHHMIKTKSATKQEQEHDHGDQFTYNYLFDFQIEESHDCGVLSFYYQVADSWYTAFSNLPRFIDQQNKILDQAQNLIDMRFDVHNLSLTEVGSHCCDLKYAYLNLNQELQDSLDQMRTDFSNEAHKDVLYQDKEQAEALIEQIRAKYVDLEGISQEQIDNDLEQLDAKQIELLAAGESKSCEFSK